MPSSGLRSEEHTSELQSLRHLVCRLLVEDRKSTRLNSSHLGISYAVFCLKKKSLLAQTHGRWQQVCPALSLARHPPTPGIRRCLSAPEPFFLKYRPPPEFHPFPPRDPLPI